MEYILFPLFAIAIAVLLISLIKLLPDQVDSFIFPKYLNFAEYRGRKGEHLVFSLLKQLPDEYYIWNDIVVERSGYSVQIDHVVISPYGIFVIETKNYTGSIFGNNNSDQWSKNKYGYKYYFNNPLKQNYAHVKALANLFCMSEDSFISIVVFLDGADLYCNTKGSVIYAEQLLDHIYQYRRQVMTHSDVQRLANILDVATIETKDTRKKHLSKVHNAIDRKNYYISIGICPKCGGKLIRRKGRFNYFLGCSNYPSCSFTTPL